MALKEMNFEDSFPFGKFKGRSILSAMRSDPDYVYWLHNETAGKFILDEESLMLLDHHLARVRDAKIAKFYAPNKEVEQCPSS